MSDIVERLRVYAEDDHERLCQGREYTCSCGYDDKRDSLLTEAADTIAALTARVAELEAALRPLACTCEAESQDECSRSEKHCPFWNARAAITQETE